MLIPWCWHAQHTRELSLLAVTCCDAACNAGVLATTTETCQFHHLHLPSGAIVLVQCVGVNFVEYAPLHVDFEIFQDHLRKKCERGKREGERGGWGTINSLFEAGGSQEDHTEEQPAARKLETAPTNAASTSRKGIAPPSDQRRILALSETQAMCF